MTIKPLVAAALLSAVVACSSFDSTSPPARSAVLSERSESKGQDDTALGTSHIPCHPERSTAEQCVVEGRGKSKTPIQHVVFIIQENRSFNNLFMSFPHATTQRYGYDTSGEKIALHAVDLSTTYDIDHSSTAFFAACDGSGQLPGTNCKMDGWNKEQATLHAPANAAYGYVAQSEIKPYWTLAKQYVLADDTFASNLDASFVAHQYVVAGFAAHSVNGPAGPWGCEGGKPDTVPILTKKRTIGKNREVACFDFPTLADEADAAGVTWRYYAESLDDYGGIWSAYQADDKIYHGADWNTDVINPGAQFLTDIGNGELANVTWIAPTYATSDHSGMQSKDGPAWVSSIVDAIGTSRFWKSTAIFILWDDWGGWFDPVKPVYEDYDGLGFRIPLVIVSPYARQCSVTHTQYETASVLRFMEDAFDLAPMAKSDSRANDPANDRSVFDFSQKPRKFKKIAGAKPAGYWFELQRSENAESKPVAQLDGD